MNVSALHPNDFFWADYIFINAWHIQQESVDKIIDLCLKYDVKIIAGDPLFTQKYAKYPQIDALLNCNDQLIFNLWKILLKSNLSVNYTNILLRQQRNNKITQQKMNNI